jgi:hypothetical protein
VLALRSIERFFCFRNHRRASVDLSALICGSAAALRIVSVPMLG